MLGYVNRLLTSQKCIFHLGFSLGTFIGEPDGSYRYAEDIDNYYAVNQLMVWKPDAVSLDLIVNHQHRTNDIPVARKGGQDRAHQVCSR